VLKAFPKFEYFLHLAGYRSVHTQPTINRSTPTNHLLIIRIPTKDLLPRHLRLPQNRLPPLLTPDPNLQPIILRTDQETLTIRSLGIDIQILRSILSLKLESPQQFCKAKPHVPFGEVDAGTHAPSTAVAVVVAVAGVGGLREFRRQGGDASVVGWVEDGGIGEFDAVVVETPGVDEDYGVLGDEEAIDPVI
jgi:hypothetical protein